MDLAAPPRFAYFMADGTNQDSPTSSPERVPLGSWARLYTLCCVLAIVVMALLYWFAQAYNIRPVAN